MLGSALAAALLFVAADDIVVPPQYDFRDPSCTHSECAAENPLRPFCADAESTRCVQCLDDVHCESGMVCLEFGQCSFLCEADDACSDPLLPRCDPADGRCVECIEQSDCESTHECNADGRCTPIHTCVPGTITCSGESRVECSPSGDTVIELERCSYYCAGGTCIEDPDPDPDEGEEGPIDRGCACGAGGAPGGVVLPLLGVLGLRRRYQA